MKRMEVFVLIVMLIFNSNQFAVGAVDNKDFSIDGYNEPFKSGKINIYEGGESATVFKSSEYNFRYAFIFTFNKNGKLIEGGNNLLPDSGSPQLSIFVPAGGFAVAFDSQNTGLMNYYNKIFDGVMIYNGTMPLIYDMKAEYDKKTNKLNIDFGDPVEPTDKTTKILFVGNSSTYYSGTPIVFEGLCRSVGLDVKVYYCTFGSSNFGQFASETHDYGKSLRSNLSQNKYDYIVLQDAANLSFYDSDKPVATLLELIKENGATPLLYMRYSTSVEGSHKYNVSYNKLGEKYNIKVMPSAQAFAYCLIDYPDIKIFADDNGHHSHAGSYLAACTWLYSLFDKTPVGNEYIATLDATTAKQLQTTAVRGCDDTDGLYKTTQDGDTFIENGTVYQNISRGKSYIPSGSPYEGKWTDTENGKPIGKLTDGLFASGGEDTAIGCYSGNNTNITIDLGEEKAVKRVVTDLYGGNWGIPDPTEATVALYVSNNGISFNKVENLSGVVKTSGAWKQRELALTLSDTVNARYVRIEYEIIGNFCWTSEIAVYGSTAKQGEVSTVESSVESNEQSNTESNAHDNTKKEPSNIKAILTITGIAVTVAVVSFVFISLKKKKKK